MPSTLALSRKSCVTHIYRKQERMKSPSPRERSEWGEGGDGARAPERGEGCLACPRLLARKLCYLPILQTGEAKRT